jgi:two-component system LytT family response regulator
LLNKIDSLLERHNTSIKRRKTEVSQNATYNLPDKLIFHNLNGFVFIDPENIIYIKAEGNYSTFFLENNQKEMVTENLGRIYTRLNKSIFIRTKRSYIINSKYLSRIDISKKICILSKNGAEFHCSISKEQIINFSKNLKTRQVYTHSHLNITSNPTSLPEKEYDSSFS